jgi:ABC-type Fe3+-siderophore transport system permease subunit
MAHRRGTAHRRRAGGGKLSRLKNRLPFVVYLLIVIAILGFLSLIIGPTKLSASEVFVSTFAPWKDTVVSGIIWQIRMPRLFLEILSGTLLAMAGSIILGIFGTIIVDHPVAKSLYLLCGAVAAISVFLIAFGFNLNSLFPLLLGSLVGTTWDKVLLSAVFIAAGLIVYIFYYKDMNALLFGEYTAKTLGVEVGRIRVFLFFVAVILSAAAAYFCGLLCLTGLIFPYFVRLVTGVNYKYLIPVSILTSASLVILVDIFSRIIFPTELPLGIIMVILSGPLFIYALQRRRLGL